MARRKITTRGRVVAAGVCVGIAGLLAGLMAATDDTGSASADTSSTGSVGSVVPGSGTQGSGDDGSYDADGDGRVGDPGDFSGTHGQVPGGFDDGNRFGDGDSFGSGQSGSSGTSQQPSFPQPDTRSGGS